MKGGAEYLTVAKIARPRGNKGEVAAENLVGGFDCFVEGRKLDVVLADRTQVVLQVESAWEHKGRLILKFEGIATIGDAERLRLAEVRMAKADLPGLPAGEYYFDDLVGCRLVDEATGRELGSVAEVYEPPSGALLFSVIDEERKEMLVPFVTEICRDVDIAAKRIVARLPEGMDELKA